MEMNQGDSVTDSVSIDSTPDAPSKKRSQLLLLMRKKEEIEAKIRALYELLNGQDQVGMEGPLLDSEGYPRSDIDVYAVRHARHKIICLNNDHKALMQEIEDGLFSFHAQIRDDHMYGLEKSGTAESTNKPFAKVQFVTPDSPAAQAGLQSGDLITAFGSAVRSNFHTLSDLATVITNSENRAINVEVVRRGEIKRITLTPRKWSGRGLVGFRPYHAVAGSTNHGNSIPLSECMFAMCRIVQCNECIRVCSSCNYSAFDVSNSSA